MSPHVELLAYQHPVASMTGLLAEITDIASDKIVIRCSDVGKLAANLGIVAGLVRLTSGEPCLLFRDPDGHLLMAIE